MPPVWRAARGIVSRATLWLTTASCVIVVALAWQTSPFINASPSQYATTPQGDEKQARAVCGVCHAFPQPDILPRHAWRDEFVRMMFIRLKRLPPLGPPSAVQLPADMERVLPFYLSHAPEHLPAPEAWPDPSESPIQFARHSLTMPDMPNT